LFPWHLAAYGAYGFIKPCWTLFECWSRFWALSLTHKHLFSKHWGELIDIDSVWKDLDGDMPELIYSNPQFALPARDATQMTRSKGTGKGTAPAVGGRAPAVGGRSRVWHRDGDRCLIKQAIVITLPDLFLNMRTDYTAAVLYCFWCKFKNRPWFNSLSACSQRCCSNNNWCVRAFVFQRATEYSCT
jgi:hypothetical protein